MLLSEAMAQVGEAAAQGQTPRPSVMANFRELMRVAPLSIEPVLVQAAIALKAGDTARAEQLLLEARRRNPRSAAARYLLAETWLAEGHIEDGLSEMALLARLLPGSTPQLAPALSQYARTPGATARLRRMLETNPSLKQPLLNALAADPDNIPQILELNRSVRDPAGIKSRPWQSTLLKALVSRGEYQRAYGLWSQLSGVSGPRPLLFNEGFRELSAPPPFNWDFSSGSAGVVEPGDGRMRVLFYGRDNAVLASQLLLLRPGAYRFSIGQSGKAAPGALSWLLACLPGRRPLMELDLSSSAPPPASFEVPASGCDAEILELNGRALDMPQDSDLLVGPVSLQRSGK